MKSDSSVALVQQLVDALQVALYMELATNDATRLLVAHHGLDSPANFKTIRAALRAAEEAGFVPAEAVP